MNQDMSDSEFILDARDHLKQGDMVTFHVGFLAPEEGVVTGTLFPVRDGAWRGREGSWPLILARVDVVISPLKCMRLLWCGGGR